MRTTLKPPILTLLALAATAMGCELITLVDASLLDGGAPTSTTTSTTSTSTGGGQGGGGGAMACQDSIDCPQPSNECEKATCTHMECSVAHVAKGSPTAQQTPGNCKRRVCDGQGSTTIQIDNTDIPDDGKQCTIDACSNGVPYNGNLPAGTSCSDGSGTHCDGSGNCL